MNIRDLLKDHNKKMGRKPSVRVVSVSCLDLCDYGPNIVVHRDDRVYSHLTRELANAVYAGEMGDAERREDLELSEEEMKKSDER